MALNQQLTKENSKDFYEKIIEIMGGFTPYVTTYLERKEEGWSREYLKTNKYVSEIIDNDKAPYLKQYHNAWERFKNKKELIELIKSCEYLETKSALEILEKVTGISEVQTQELTLEQVCKELGRDVKIIK